MLAAALQLLALLPLLHYADAALSGLVLCDPSDPQQIFTYDSASQHIQLASQPSKCLMIATGCCDGELIRAGSTLELQDCSKGFESQKLSWPSAASSYLLRPLSTAGEPTVSVLPHNATLVFDARGQYFGGVPLLGGAYSAAYSHFYATPSGQLASNATPGLCLSAALPPALPATLGQALNLQPCAPSKQVPGDFASTQLFALAPTGQVLTSEGLCLTAQQPLDASGSAALVSATCTVPPGAGPAFASQAFALTAAARLTALALPGAPSADAGAAAWWGARLPLTPAAAATPGGLLTLQPVNASAAYGALVHAQTGMCLDAGGVPEGQGCLDAAVRGLPFCSPQLPLQQRLEDLLGRLTLDEAVGMLGDAGDQPGPCSTHTAAVPRLGITAMRWLVEVSSMAGASATCSPLTPWHASCPTSFPAAMMITGAFNRSLWKEHGRVVGDEMRAMTNILTSQPVLSGTRVSLAGHGPDLNNPRDSRNGRNGELSSEDPFLSGQFGRYYVEGMQFGRSDAPRSVNSTRRMLASLKHYTAYSRETDRMGSLGNVSLFDLWDTYLPQYKEAMTESYAAGTMCSYYSMRLSGAPGPVTYVPSCANEYTLTTVVREYWGRPDAVHLSDCGAVVNMIRPPPAGNGYTPGSFSGAAAAALNAGLDQNSNTISPSHLWEALTAGTTTSERVYAAAGRVLAQRFRLGQFDPLEALPSELLALGAHSIGSAENRAAAAEGVRQGAVLVRNTAAALPLTPGRRLLVLGPTALSATAAIGDMYASPNALCPDDTGDCWPVLGQALTAGNAGGATTVLPGVAMSANDTAAWGPALAAAALGASAWDAVVLALGSDRSVAGEGSDRTDIGLPGVQEAFALAVLSAVSGSGAGAPPVTLLLVHNLPLSYDALLAHPSPPAAIVDAWAPTSHADALADLLFGRANQWGRSTLTLFPAAYAQAVALEDMAMPASAGSAGRGYRYYDGRAGAPLIEFGEGLSGYSSFGLQCALQGGSGSGSTAAGGAAVAIACNVTLGSGSRAGDEVLTVFHRPGSDVVGRVGGAHPLPLRALRDFARVSLPGQPGSSAQVDFALVLNSSLTFNNEVGAQVLYPGTHFLDVWNGNTNNVTLTVTLTGDVVVVSAPPLPW